MIHRGKKELDRPRASVARTLQDDFFFLPQSDVLSFSRVTKLCTRSRLYLWSVSMVNSAAHLLGAALLLRALALALRGDATHLLGRRLARAFLGLARHSAHLLGTRSEFVGHLARLATLLGRLPGLLARLLDAAIPDVRALLGADPLHLWVGHALAARLLLDRALLGTHRRALAVAVLVVRALAIVALGCDLARFTICLLYTSPSPRDRG